MAKIWIVEDDRNLANLTKIALVKNGYDVAVFHEAIKSIEEAKKQKPDLILMDIMLPELSGAEAVKALRKDPNSKDIQVIFLTGLISSGEDALEETGITVDGINYKTLGKPYEIEQLLKLVESALRYKGRKVF